MTFMKYKRNSSESGFTLLMTMILLLMLSILGVASSNTSLVNTRITHNFYDRSDAYQIANAALNFVEGLLDDPIYDQPPDMDFCANGLHDNALRDANERFRNINYNCWADVAPVINPNGSRPQYYIEYYGEEYYDDNAPCAVEVGVPNTCLVYSITICYVPNRDNINTCSNPRAGGTNVYLRSYYVRLKR